jgi:hypothetical protein
LKGIRGAVGIGGTALLALSTAACEMSLTPSITPTVDIEGRAGVEGRVEFGMAFGPPGLGVFAQIGPGGGFNEDLGGYFIHESTAGMHFGDVEDPEEIGQIRGRVGLTMSLRYGENGYRIGPEGLLDLLFSVAHTKGPFGIFLLGPRLQVDGILPDDEEGVPRGAIFMPGFVFQWLFVASYGEPRRPPPMMPVAPPPVPVQ